MSIKKEKIVYECIKCNRIFKQKCHLDKHIYNKKHSCEISKSNIDILNKQIKENNLNEEIEINEKTKLNVIEEKVNLYDMIFNNTDISKSITCKYCNNAFSYKSSLIKHEKERCKAKKSYEELELLKEKLKTLATENEQLKKEMTELKHTKILNKNVTNYKNTNNKINNGVINNNTINVQLVQFGNENIDDIDTKEALDVYLKSTGGNIISNILKLINLNEKYPENHNICISDLSRELVKIFDGKNFIIKKFKNVKGDILGKLVKNTYKIVDKIENDELIKKTPDVKSKMKINGVSLKLIDGCPPEEIVRDEAKEKAKMLKCEAKKNNNSKKNNNKYSDSDDEEEIEFNLEELLRIEHLENKQSGLLEIALERLKEELYNGKIIICE